jgi:cytochrome c-type biogenesis protein
MTEVELTLALGAGMLAAVNPCGFALLPAYLSLLVLNEESSSLRAAVRRALIFTAAMTAGFVAVFGVFGLVISPIASAVQRYLPWVDGRGGLRARRWRYLAARRSLAAYLRL